MDGLLGPSSMLPPLTVTRDFRRPLSAQDWEDQRMTFERLYSTERRSLQEVMEVMEREYGFRATYVQLISASHVSPLFMNHSVLRRHGEADADLESVNTKEKYRCGISIRTSRVMRWKG